MNSEANNKYKCEACDCEMLKSSRKRHELTKKHLNNIKSKPEGCVAKEEVICVTTQPAKQVEAEPALQREPKPEGCVAKEEVKSNSLVVNEIKILPNVIQDIIKGYYELTVDVFEVKKLLAESTIDFFQLKRETIKPALQYHSFDRLKRGINNLTSNNWISLDNIARMYNFKLIENKSNYSISRVQKLLIDPERYTPYTTQDFESIVHEEIMRGNETVIGNQAYKARSNAYNDVNKIFDREDEKAFNLINIDELVEQRFNRLPTNPDRIGIIRENIIKEQKHKIWEEGKARRNVSYTQIEAKFTPENWLKLYNKKEVEIILSLM